MDGRLVGWRSVGGWGRQGKECLDGCSQTHADATESQLRMPTLVRAAGSRCVISHCRGRWWDCVHSGAKEVWRSSLTNVLLITHVKIREDYLQPLAEG